MKITDLRNTQSMGWVADGYACSGAVSKISVPLSEVTLDELVEFALTDPAHDRYSPEAEQEHQAADYADWMQQTEDLRHGG